MIYLFPTQQLSTVHGRTCLLSTDPGDWLKFKQLERCLGLELCVLNVVNTYINNINRRAGGAQRPSTYSSQA